MVNGSIMTRAIITHGVTTVTLGQSTTSTGALSVLTGQSQQDRVRKLEKLATTRSHGIPVVGSTVLARDLNSVKHANT